MPPDIAKSDLLNEWGYAGRAEEALRALEEAGLTNPRKSRISRAKLDAAREVLEARFLRVCANGDCRRDGAAMAGDRTVVEGVAQPLCDVCGGSPVTRALDAMREACLRVGWRRLCIVGGSPNTRTQLEALSPPLELKLVDGTTARTKAQAKRDIALADRVVVWGGTELDHKVSKLYSADPKATTVAKRGVKELCAHVVESAGSRGRWEAVRGGNRR